VTGDIDLEHEERHALEIGAAQRGHTICCLLEGDAETGLEHIDVIAGALGRGVKRLVGHHQRVRRIAGELEAGDAAGLVA
jgi:hypothetical protein